MHEPTHWYTHNCDFCFTQTKINFTEQKPDQIFCPHCGTAVEDADELDFDE